MADEDRTVWVQVGERSKVRCLLPEPYSVGWPFTMAMLDAIARDDGSVLITGETGTGKELLARYLHDKSRRAQGPYVTVNCSGLTEERMQGELFGWGRGAFTGAVDSHEGIITRAQGGTVFLDEIGNMDRQNQGRLLRFMQTGEIQPLAKPTEQADVRIIAATNKPVDARAESAHLVADLFHRFRFSDLRLPPLRERGADLFRLLLRDDFLGVGNPFTGITVCALSHLAAYDWPGNIRELHRYCQNARLFAMLREDGGLLPPLHVHHNEFAFGIEHNLRRKRAIDAYVEAARRALEVQNQPDDGRARQLVSTARLLVLLTADWPLQVRFDPEDILPLARIDAMLRAHGSGEGPFDFAQIDERMERHRELWHLEGRANGPGLQLTEALQFVGGYCHALALLKRPWVPRESSPQFRDEVCAKSDPFDWGLPSMPKRDSEIEDRLDKLDLSRARKCSHDVVKRVLRLYHEGLSKKGIVVRLHGELTEGRVGHVITTYGNGFAPPCPSRAGRPRKDRPESRAKLPPSA